MNAARLGRVQGRARLRSIEGCEATIVRGHNGL
jgi:hypothetical protein